MMHTRTRRHWSGISKRIADLVSGATRKTRSHPIHAAAKNTSSPESLHIDIIRQRFSQEMFAQLLLELPRHRQHLDMAFAIGDSARLRTQVHKLLGAVVYSDQSGLEMALRSLQCALRQSDRQAVDSRFRDVMREIDQLLASAGYSAR